jgi:pimeloyl-ACP methyl ester carboxylesterase
MKRIARLFILILFLLISPQLQAQTADTLVDTGPCKLHFKITKGTGTAILFEAGGAMDASQWDAVAAAVHQATGAPIITYDRQGFGKSGLDTLHYNITSEITALETALQKLGYAHTPVITVCHSLGNFYGSLYASRHPKLVKGMVMLDPRVASLYDRQHAQEIFNSLDQAKLKQESWVLYQVLLLMAQNGDIVRQAVLPASLPILDIMAKHGPFQTEQENDHFKKDQREFIKKFTYHRLIFARGSEHNIAGNQPKLVIKHIIAFYRLHAS